MCHGAGDLAGHVQFGARTGGATIILGTLLLIVALGFAGSVGTLLRMLPASILGAILFLAGVQITLGLVRFQPRQGRAFYDTVHGRIAVWNVGAAFVIGLGLRWLLARGYVRL